MGCCHSISGYTDGRSINYKKIESDLKTGDIVLFSGRGLFSSVVKFATTSPWSHIGVIIRDKTGELYLWHSTNEEVDGVNDEFSGEPKKGAQLNQLDIFLSKYKGEFAVRMLNKEIPITSELLDYLEETSEKGYETNIDEMANASLNGLLCGRRYGSSYELFCSEAVADFYIKCGLIDPDEIGDPSTLTPLHFTSAGDGIEAEEDVVLLNGYILGPEIQVKIKKTYS